MGYINRGLLAAVATFLFSSTAFSQVIGSGTILVGLAPVEVRVEKDQRQDSGPSDYLAKTTVELLPNYIQRGLERGLDRRVVIANLPTPDPVDGSSAIPSAELYPTVQSMGTLGIRITVRLLKRPALKASSGTP